MGTAVIHRPYFLPWLGYFTKLVYADTFIVQDNFIFTKRLFIDRARITNSNGQPSFISLKTGENYNKLCNQIYFNASNIFKIIETVRHAYVKAPYFEEFFEVFSELLISSADKSTNLAEFDTELIRGLINILDIRKPNIVMSSNIIPDDAAPHTEKIIELCRKTHSNSIIIGGGGGLTELEEQKLLNSGVSILIQDFKRIHPRYYQYRRSIAGFIPCQSVIDCIFNEGIDFTKKIIEDTRYLPKIYNRSSR